MVMPLGIVVPGALGDSSSLILVLVVLVGVLVVSQVALVVVLARGQRRLTSLLVGSGTAEPASESTDAAAGVEPVLLRSPEPAIDASPRTPGAHEAVEGENVESEPEPEPEAETVPEAELEPEVATEPPAVEVVTEPAAATPPAPISKRTTRLPPPVTLKTPVVVEAPAAEVVTEVVPEAVSTVTADVAAPFEFDLDAEYGDATPSVRLRSEPHLQPVQQQPDEFFASSHPQAQQQSQVHSEPERTLPPVTAAPVTAPGVLIESWASTPPPARPTATQPAQLQLVPPPAPAPVAQQVPVAQPVPVVQPAPAQFVPVAQVVPVAQPVPVARLVPAPQPAPVQYQVPAPVVQQAPPAPAPLPQAPYFAPPVQSPQPQVGAAQPAAPGQPWFVTAPLVHRDAPPPMATHTTTTSQLRPPQVPPAGAPRHDTTTGVVYRADAPLATTGSLRPAAAQPAHQTSSRPVTPAPAAAQHVDVPSQAAAPGSIESMAVAAVIDGGRPIPQVAQTFRVSASLVAYWVSKSGRTRTH